jgi:hypothetical protein
MRLSTIPPALLVIALAGCAADVPTAPTATAPPSLAGTYTAAPIETGMAALDSTRRPINGRCEATYAEPPVVAFPFIRHVSTGACQLSHLGRVTLRTEAEINLVTGVQLSQVTFTAPNGDRLRASSVGTGTPAGPTTIRFSGTSSITGGTGRFAGATGEMSVEGTVDNASGDARFSYDGWITYDASGRSHP